MATNNQTNPQLIKNKPLFIHNTFQNLINGLGKWFTIDFYNEFNQIIVSTYFKAIQQWTQDNEGITDGSKFVLNTPSILIDPTTGTVNLNKEGGYNMWRFDDFSTKLAAEIYKPFFETDKVNIYQITNRVEFGMDVIINCESIYQLMDFKMRMLQWCHGLNKPFSKSHILPIKTYVILPTEISQYLYENYYTGESFTVDIKQYFDDTNICDFKLIETINQTELIMVFPIYPMLTLQSLSDTSQIYGGTDLPTYSLTASFNVETEYNTHLLLETDWKIEKMDLHWRFGYVDSVFNNEQNSSMIVFPNVDPYIPNTNELKYKGKYYYIATQDHDTPFTIDIGEPIDEVAIPYTIVSTKYGQLIFGKGDDGGGFYIEPSNPSVLEISFLELKKDDIVEIVVYKI